MRDDVLIRVQDLKKYFNVGKGKLKAVDGLTFDIYRGETLGLVGESGCGKSTAGRTMLRLYEPTGGKVEFEGKDVFSTSASEMQALRRDMQMIFQDPYASLDPRMTVTDIISEPYEIHGLYKNHEERADRVASLLKTVGLNEEHALRFPHEFSGGQRQRIGVARALALDPKFIVCDEPVSALDVSIQAQILNLMNEIQEQRGLTYMFITHDLSVVNHFSDDIAVMYLGKLIEKAPSEVLFANPVHPYTQALLSAIPLPKLGARKERILLKGEITSPINPAPVCRFANRCQYATDRCRSEEPQLKEIETGHFVSCFLCE